MTHQVERCTVEARPLLSIRRDVEGQPLSRLVPAMCGLAWAATQERKIQRRGRMIAIYPDCKTVEVGVEVFESFTPEGPVLASETPAGRVARTIHVGPYADLGRAHEAVRLWCASEGETLAGPSWEIYGHGTEDPAEATTEVVYLLEG